MRFSVLPLSVASSVTDASQGLIATIITGFVTIIVTLIGVFATRTRGPGRHRHDGDDEEDAPRRREISDPIAIAEINDLRSQRDAVQRKLDQERREVTRLMRLCYEGGINPYTGARVDERSTGQ